MPSDHEQIRALVSTWMSATKQGDIATVLDLMTDDVVFLMAGKDPMKKSDFLAAAKAQAEGSAPKFDGRSDIQEIEVLGDWAYMWSHLTVIATPPDGSAPSERSGHTLTVLKKENGRWRIARDANMLAPAPSPKR